LANDLFSLLKRHDALAQVGIRMLALGILKQDHDTLTLIRWKLPRILLKAGPAGRLAGTNGLEVTGRRLVPGHAGLPRILLLRTRAQENCADSNHNEYSHEIWLPRFARPTTGILTKFLITLMGIALRGNKLSPVLMLHSHTDAASHRIFAYDLVFGS